MPATVKLFIRNKTDDFIAELTVADGQLPDPLPEKIVLTGFSREGWLEGWLLRTEARPERTYAPHLARELSSLCDDLCK